MATIGALIWKLGLDISDLHENIGKATAKLDSMESLAKKAGGALAGMVSVAGIQSLATSLLDSADALVKMSAQTGIGTTGLQALQAAATGGGNTLEEVAKAVNKMQVNLAGGGANAVQGVKTLGLSFDALRGDRKAHV
jgi:hypothetical protein